MTTDEKRIRYLKRMTTDLREARNRIRELEYSDVEPVAIVAMRCRYPGGCPVAGGLVAAGGGRREAIRISR